MMKKIEQKLYENKNNDNKNDDDDNRLCGCINTKYEIIFNTILKKQSNLKMVKTDTTNTTSSTAEKWIGATHSSAGKLLNILQNELSENKNKYSSILKYKQEIIKYFDDKKLDKEGIKKLNEKGIVCYFSKNDFDMAIDVLDNHPRMILKSKDFTV